MGLDAIVAIGGLILPPLVDFIKKKWLKSSDTPEATMSTLATTKPDVLPMYLQAMAGWLDAQTRYFNRDVTGTPSKWVTDVRAIIRPVGTIGAGLTLMVMVAGSLSGWKIDPSMQETLTGVRYSCEVIVSSWFGDRIRTN
jgi:hypothetical protein